MRPGEVRTAASVVMLATVAVGACTYGELESSATIDQVVRLGESTRALIVVGHERSRRPTGLSAFPDGGKRKYEHRSAAVHLVDVAERTALELVSLPAPDSIWESYSVSIRGLAADSIAYVAQVGCARGGECYPDLWNTALMRLTTSGSVRPVDAVPPGVGLPGQMLARRAGEAIYLRFSVRGDELTVRDEDNGPFRPRWRVNDDGSLVTLDDGE